MGEGTQIEPMPIGSTFCDDDSDTILNTVGEESTPAISVLRFEAGLVNRIKHASHTTQRNPQQCLMIWDRCNKILPILDDPSRTPYQNSLERNMVLTEFDMYVLQYYLDESHIRSDSTTAIGSYSSLWLP